MNKLERRMNIPSTNWVGILNRDTAEAITAALKERFETASFRTTIQDVALGEGSLLTAYHDARKRDCRRAVISLLGMSERPTIFISNHENISILVIETGSLVVLNPFGLIVVRESLELRDGKVVPSINCLFCEEQAIQAFNWGAEAIETRFFDAMRGTADPDSRLWHIIANHDKKANERKRYEQ